MAANRIRDSLGPSIIVAAAVVGTGELVVAPSLGAKVGLSALWIIIIGCIVKVLLQEELGRHTILTGETTLAAFNRIRPQWRLSWVVWVWLLLLVSTSFQQGGILASIVQAMKLLKVPGNPMILAWLIAFASAGILITGKYSRIEKTSALLVAGFTFLTVIAMVLLQWTPHKISLAQLAEGLQFRMPQRGFADAVTVFGITGIGTSELLFYPYWCLEKGYASDLASGIQRDMALVRQRILGMRIDISAALFIYTFATIAFYLLGATILHSADQIPQGLGMVRTLSQMYTAVFGPWIFYLFAFGAFFVLYSTFFVGLATFSRICVDTIRLAAPASSINASRATPIAIMILALVYLVLSLCFAEIPHRLIIYGGAVQTLLLPVFGFAVLRIRRARQDPFKPGKAFDAALYLSLAIITIAAVCGAWGMLFPAAK